MAVLVTRGSTTMSLRGFVPGPRSTRWHRMGWLSAMLAPIRRMTSALFHIGVGAGWAVGAEGELVAGDGGGHAEGRVAVVIARAQAKLNEFAEGVELLGEKLTGADDAERFVAMALLNIADAFDHSVEGFVPGDGNEHTVLPKQRLFGAARSGEDVVLGEALGAELAAIDGVVRVAADGDRLVVAHAEQACRNRPSSNRMWS